MPTRAITLIVNGHKHTAEVPTRLTLVDFLREHLSLTGTHVGCEHGVCGACSVLLGRRAVRSCLMFAVQADGMEIITVEGLAPDPETLSTLQDCFWETHALQCGFCTSGMLIAARALLMRNLAPTEEEIREAIGGNLCRCTGYKPIFDAIKLAAARMQRANENARSDASAE